MTKPGSRNIYQHKPRGIIELKHVTGLEVGNDSVLALLAPKENLRWEASGQEAAKRWGEAWETALKPGSVKVVWKMESVENSQSTDPQRKDIVPKGPTLPPSSTAAPVTKGSQACMACGGTGCGLCNTEANVKEEDKTPRRKAFARSSTVEDASKDVLSQLPNTCACGSIFEADSKFCRKCGKARENRIPVMNKPAEHKDLNVHASWKSAFEEPRKTMPGNGCGRAALCTCGAPFIDDECGFCRTCGRVRTSHSAQQDGPEGLQCEGVFDLQEEHGDNPQINANNVHFILYGDRLEYGDNREQCLQSPTMVLPEDIEDLEVVENGFVIRLHDEDHSIIRMFATSGINLEEWRTCFCKLFGEPAPHFATGTTATPATTHSGSSTPNNPATVNFVSSQVPEEAGRRLSLGAKRNSRGSISTRGPMLSMRGPMLHEGPLMLVRHKHQDAHDGKAEMSHVLAFQDRFEHYPDKSLAACCASPRVVIRASDVREVRLQDVGFILGLDTENLIFRVPAGEDLEPWVDAMSSIFDASRIGQGSEEVERPQAQQRKLQTRWSKDSRLPENPAATYSQLKQQAAGSKVAEWATATEEQPHYHGILGFQIKGKMVRKYCALYHNRIDVWSGVEPIARGRRAEDRILLENIRSVETVFGGFILNFGEGKRTGVHVDNVDELRDWSAELARVVSAAGPPMPIRGGGGGPRTPRSYSSSAQCHKDNEVKPAPKARSASWVPRVATLAKKEEVSPESAAARQTLYTRRGHRGKVFLVNTHSGGMQAARHLHSNNVVVMVQATMPGSSRLNTAIAEKVNEQPRSARLPRGIQADLNLTDKVTGNAPHLSPRMEPGSLNWVKCQHVEGTPPATVPRTLMGPQPTGVPYATVNVPHCPPSQRPMSPRPPGGYPVTGKVNESLCRATPRSVCQMKRDNGLTAKVTDRSLDGTPVKARQRSAPALRTITEPPRTLGGWTHHRQCHL
mmetsp:Transcript_32756/g.64530  ORF Transcript_32756/g.64530 Transcript_32756/m.64530 type:complete len:967 (-) Transcript_32756:164-3064(-)